MMNMHNRRCCDHLGLNDCVFLFFLQASNSKDWECRTDWTNIEQIELLLAEIRDCTQKENTEKCKKKRKQKAVLFLVHN